MSTIHHEAKLSIELREKLGSRHARALRQAGRIPASLRFDGTASEPTHFSIDEADFSAAHRQEVHLFDLDFGQGGVRSAVIREIQYDAFGSELLHVEFKGVIRGQRANVMVPVHPVGQALGTLNQTRDAVEVNCLPREIPDMIELSVDRLPAGTQLHSKDLVLPEGVQLSEAEAKRNEVILTVIGMSSAADDAPAAAPAETPAP